MGRILVLCQVIPLLFAFMGPVLGIGQLSALIGMADLL